MKNLYFLVVLASLAAFLITGCAEKEVEPEPTETEPKTVQKEPEQKEPEQKEPEQKEPEPKKIETKKIEPKKEPEPKKIEPKIEEAKKVEEKKRAAAQKQEVSKEEAEIAVEQDADKSVEAPKAVTIISAPPEETDTAVVEMELVYFDYDKSVISPAFAEIIQKNYEWIAENPDVQIQLEGHCDERGTNEYNLALGERRAKAVFDHLVNLGANPSQFSMVSFGEERPAASGSNEVSWGKNRRVEFTRL